MPTAPRPSVPILLVDDRPANLLALEAVLHAPGYECVRASSGAEAIALVRDTRFAAIVLDVHMPELDGYETARRIKALPCGKDVPIIFVTAVYTEPADVQRGYDVGGLDYLGKPFHPELLRAKVGIYARLYATGSERRAPAGSREIAWALRRLERDITDRWAQGVRADPRVSEAARLPDIELRAHIPRLIEGIASAVGDDSEQASTLADAARRHTHQRLACRYELRAVLRELSHLRAAIAAILAEHEVEPDPAAAGTIAACVDEIMAASAVEIASRPVRAAAGLSRR